MEPKYGDIERCVYDAVCALIRRARGTCRTFTPKQVARVARLSTKPVTLSVIRYILEKMVREGQIQLYKKGRTYRYIVYNTSPLWKKVKGE